MIRWSVMDEDANRDASFTLDGGALTEQYRRDTGGTVSLEDTKHSSIRSTSQDTTPSTSKVHVVVVVVVGMVGPFGEGCAHACVVSFRSVVSSVVMCFVLFYFIAKE